MIPKSQIFFITKNRGQIRSANPAKSWNGHILSY